MSCISFDDARCPVPEDDKGDIASAADVPINTMLAFMFGIVVSRSIVSRYDLGKAVVKTNDFVSVVNWTWEDDKLTT